MRLDIKKIPCTIVIHGNFPFIINYVFVSFQIHGNLHMYIHIIYSKFHVLVVQRQIFKH